MDGSLYFCAQNKNISHMGNINEEKVKNLFKIMSDRYSDWDDSGYDGFRNDMADNDVRGQIFGLIKNDMKATNWADQQAFDDEFGYGIGADARNLVNYTTGQASVNADAQQRAQNEAAEKRAANANAVQTAAVPDANVANNEVAAQGIAQKAEVRNETANNGGGVSAMPIVNEDTRRMMRMANLVKTGIMTKEGFDKEFASKGITYDKDGESLAEAMNTPANMAYEKVNASADLASKVLGDNEEKKHTARNYWRSQHYKDEDKKNADALADELIDNGGRNLIDEVKSEINAEWLEANKDTYKVDWKSYDPMAKGENAIPELMRQADRMRRMAPEEVVKRVYEKIDEKKIDDYVRQQLGLPAATAETENEPKGESAMNEVLDDEQKAFVMQMLEYENRMVSQRIVDSIRKRYADEFKPDGALAFISEAVMLDTIYGKLMQGALNRMGASDYMALVNSGREWYGRNKANWAESAVAAFTPMAIDYPAFAAAGAGSQLVGKAATATTAWGLGNAWLIGSGARSGFMKAIGRTVGTQAWSNTTTAAARWALVNPYTSFISRRIASGIASTGYTLANYNIMGHLASGDLSVESAVESIKEGYGTGVAFGTIGSLAGLGASRFAKVGTAAAAYGLEGAYMSYEDLVRQAEETGSSAKWYNMNWGRAVGYGYGMATMFKMQHAVQHPAEFVRQFKADRFARSAGFEWGENDTMAMGEKHKELASFIERGDKMEDLEGAYRAAIEDRDVPIEQKRKLTYIFEDAVTDYGKMLNSDGRTVAALDPLSVVMNAGEMYDKEKGEYTIVCMDGEQNIVMKRTIRISEKELEEKRKDIIAPYFAAMQANNIRQIEATITKDDRLNRRNTLARMDDATKQKRMAAYMAIDKLENSTDRLTLEELKALKEYVDALQHIGQTAEQRAVDVATDGYQGVVRVGTDGNGNAVYVVTADESGNSVQTIDPVTAETRTEAANSVEIVAEENAQEVYNAVTQEYDPEVGAQVGNKVWVKRGEEWTEVTLHQGDAKEFEYHTDGDYDIVPISADEVNALQQQHEAEIAKDAVREQIKAEQQQALEAEQEAHDNADYFIRGENGELIPVEEYAMSADGTGYRIVAGGEERIVSSKDMIDGESVRNAERENAARAEQEARMAEQQRIEAEQKAQAEAEEKARAEREAEAKRIADEEEARREAERQEAERKAAEEAKAKAEEEKRIAQEMEAKKADMTKAVDIAPDEESLNKLIADYGDAPMDKVLEMKIAKRRKEFEEARAEAERKATEEANKAAADAETAKQEEEADEAAASRKPKYSKKEGAGARIGGDKEKKVDFKTFSLVDKIAKKLGIEVVFEDEVNGGNANAEYQDGVVRIEKGNKNPVKALLGHEVLHRIRETNAEAYEELKKALIKEVGEAQFERAIEEMTEDVYGGEIDRDAAEEEVIANMAGDILNGSRNIDGFIMNADKSVVGKMLDFVRNVKDFVDDIVNFAVNDGMSDVTGSIDGKGKYIITRASVERLEAVLIDGINASEMARDEINSQVAAEGAHTIYEDGEAVISTDKKGVIKLSQKTYEHGGRDKLIEEIDKLIKKNILKEEDKKDILVVLDDASEYMKDMLNKGFDSYNEWVEMPIVVDSATGKPVFSVIKSNGDYKMNLDFSLVCKKRRTLDAVFRGLIDKGVIGDVDLGQEDIAKINDIIRRYGFETACRLCFVDARRFRVAEVADKFANLWNGFVKMIDGGGAKIDRFNFANDPNVVSEDGEKLHEKNDADTSILENEREKWGNKTVEYKVISHLLSHPEDRKLLTRADFIDGKSFDEGAIRNEAIRGLYNAKKGSGGPKASSLDTPYNNEVETSEWERDKAYGVGGVRIQSFSDYIPNLVFDYMQMFGGLSAKRLPVQSYTKEELYVKQFGLTGAKINMSLVPMAYMEEWIKNGRLQRVNVGTDKKPSYEYRWANGNAFHAGLDENGNYLWQTGETFDYEDAVTIQNDAEYGRNCGTIAVGISDEHIRRLLSDPNIRMVIPYHKSGLSGRVAIHNSVDAFTDYTKDQGTKYMDGNGRWKNIAYTSNPTNEQNILSSEEPSFNECVRKYAAQGYEAESVQMAVKEYVDWCDGGNSLKLKLMPKFSEFLYNNDGSINRNYYKLLEDFTLIRPDGKGGEEYLPQTDIKMNFPKSGSAFGSMKELIERGLNENNILEAKRNEHIDDIVNDVVDSLGARKKSKANGSRNAKNTITESPSNVRFSRKSNESAEHYAQRVMDDYENSKDGARDPLSHRLIKKDGESAADFARRVVNDHETQKQLESEAKQSTDDGAKHSIKARSYEELKEEKINPDNYLQYLYASGSLRSNEAKRRMEEVDRKYRDPNTNYVMNMPYMYLHDDMDKRVYTEQRDALVPVYEEHKKFLQDLIEHTPTKWMQDGIRDYIESDDKMISRLNDLANGKEPKYSKKSGRPLGSETPLSEAQKRVSEMRETIDKMMADTREIISPTSGRKRTEIDIKERLNDITKFVTERIDKEIGKEIGSMEIKSILNQVKRASTMKDARKAVMQIQRMLNDAQIRIDSKELTKTLEKPTVGKDDKGIAVSKNVDNSVRKIIESVKQTIKSLEEPDGMSAEAMQTAILEDSIRAEERINNAELEGKEGSQEDYDIIYLSAPIRRQAAYVREDIDGMHESMKDWAEAENALVEYHKKTEYKSANYKKIRGWRLSKDEKDVMRIEEMLRDNLETAQDAYIEKQRVVANNLLQFNQTMKWLFAEGKERRKGIVEEQKQHRNMIIGSGLDDFMKGNQKLEGEDKEERAWDKVVRGTREVLGAVSYSLEYLLKNDANHMSGRGKLFRYFYLDHETSLTKASENKFEAQLAFNENLNKRVNVIFGDDMKDFAALKKDGEKELGTTIKRRMSKDEAEEYNRRKVDGKTDWKEGDDFEVPMTKGHALHLWLTWRQSAGKVKMAKMGYTEESMKQIENALGDKYLRFGKYLTEELLPSLREKYNERHIEMYGTELDKNENYFPLKIDKDKLKPKGGIGEAQQQMMPSSGSPYNIKRTNNTAAIDTRSDAFEVLLDYNEAMEQWYNYGKLIQDLNILHASPKFKRAMESWRKGSFQILMDAAQTATGSLYDSPQQRMVDRVARVMGYTISTFAKGAISFRLYTALKQITSYPAFADFVSHYDGGNNIEDYNKKPGETTAEYVKRVSELSGASFQAELIKNLFTPISNFKWCEENLPLFKKRVQNGDIGLEGINDNNAYDAITRKYGEWGMKPNRIMDQIAIAAGAKAVFNESYRVQIRQGVDPETARKRAVIEAEVCYNESQQSSENAFSSLVQKSNNSAVRPFTLFRNASIGYGRKVKTGIKDLAKAIKGDAVDYNGLPLSNGARKMYAARAARTIAMFGAILPYVWSRSATTNTLYGEKTDEDKWAEWKSILLGLTTDGTTIGSMVSSVGNGYEFNPWQFVADVNELRKNYNRNGWYSEQFGKLAAKKAALYSTGFNWDTWANIIGGSMDLATDLIDEDIDHGLLPDLAMDVMMMLNMNKTDRKKWAFNLYKDYGPVAYAKAYEKASERQHGLEQNGKRVREWIASKDKEFMDDMTAVKQMLRKYNELESAGDEEACNKLIEENEWLVKLVDSGDESIFYTYDSIQNYLMHKANKDDGWDIPEEDIIKELDETIEKWRKLKGQ